MANGDEQLTDREMEVLRLLLAGHTAKSTAAELGLSVHTVNDYLREARKKLGVTSSREAARILARHDRKTPENLGPNTIGMAGESAPVDSSARQPDRNRRGSILIWTIGGAIMFASILAIALLAGSSAVDDDAEPEAASLSQEDRTVRSAALDWVALVDEGEYETSWSQAGAAFKTAVSADDWAAQVEPVREPLGTVVDREIKTIDAHSELPGAPAGDYRIVQFATDFSSAAGATETVVMVEQEGEWKVVGYFIR